MLPLVSITLVTTNDSKHIPRCLTSLLSQDYTPLELVVVDNASSDGSRGMFKRLPFPVEVVCNDQNMGFSASQNRAIAHSHGEWILCLNPDTRLESNLITELVRAGELNPAIGIVCPKILRLVEAQEPNVPPRIDSTGGYFTKDLRHHDRGSQEIDMNQYNEPQYVFGYTGAAVLFRRRMVDDVAVFGQFMDEDFFLYREDADLSWRAKLMGWRCVYTPTAVAWHVRRVFASQRRSVPGYINMHSTKNRFLMRINNITPGIYRRVFVKATMRDLGIIGYVLLREWESIPGLWWVLKNMPYLRAKRRAIQSRRRVTEEELCFWFDNRPMSVPLEPELLAEWRMPALQVTNT
jgi:GT2 family glycosyltransferase